MHSFRKKSRIDQIGHQQEESKLPPACALSALSQPGGKTATTFHWKRLCFTSKVPHIQPRLKGQATPKLEVYFFPSFLVLFIHPSYDCVALSCFGLVSSFSGVMERDVTRLVAPDAPKP